MSEYEYIEIAEEVLDEFDQSDGFKQRFTGFCENAMEGKAEDTDLDRLINNVELNEDEF